MKKYIDLYHTLLYTIRNLKYIAHVAITIIFIDFETKRLTLPNFNKTNS